MSAPLTSDCATCGARIQRNGTRAPWRHQRPQASGAPHDHKATPRRRGHDCLFCDHVSPTVTAHMAHVHDAHPDRIGAGASRTMTWSCWSCATVNSPTATTCTNCGWAHPYTQQGDPMDITLEPIQVETAGDGTVAITVLRYPTILTLTAAEAATLRAKLANLQLPEVVPQ